MKVKQYYPSLAAIGTVALPAACAVFDSGGLSESFSYVRIGKASNHVVWVLLSYDQRCALSAVVPKISDFYESTRHNMGRSTYDHWYTGGKLWLPASWLLELKPPADDLTWAARLIYTGLESIE